MGQYYKVLLEEKGVKKVLNRDIDGEYTLAKIMEHSWLGNSFMDAVSEVIYKKPIKVL